MLTEAIYEGGRQVFFRDAFNRACFIPSGDAENFIVGKMSSKTRKNTNRLQRKLAATGDLKFESTSEVPDGESNDWQLWVNEFSQLEASGWKGDEKTASNSNENSRQFFGDVARRCLAKNKMSLLKVSFDGKPIGMHCDLFQHNHGAAFKIAFDQTFAEYSPGLITELENIRLLHDRGVSLVDPCADPRHPLINRVWPDRIRYQSLVISLGGPITQLATASLPILQALKNTVRKQETTR